MPNWVYNSIKVNAPVDKVQEVLDKGGLCEAYMPMPRELQNVSSPTKIVSVKEFEEQDKTKPYGIKITQEMSDLYKEKYGCDNWYDWANANWGTKWGDVRTEIFPGRKETTITFETAWSAISGLVLDLIDEDLDITEFWWEEEQQYGAAYKKVDGEFIRTHEWDIPDWDGKFYEDKEGNEIWKLSSDHITNMTTMEAGFYIEGHPDMPWDGDPSELKEEEIPF